MSRPLIPDPRWRPDRTRNVARPAPGDLVALEHRVWLVRDVADVERTADEHLAAPSAGRLSRGPYVVGLTWAGGVLPDDDPDGVYEVRIPADARHAWQVYPRGRWPRCSCCGEPTPCRLELQDRQVDAAVARLEHAESVLPGCCWACREPISRRQRSIAFPGDNLVLPGADGVRFHDRPRCLGAARAYEEQRMATA